jgi:hypothetical protein
MSEVRLEEEISRRDQRVNRIKWRKGLVMTCGEDGELGIWGCGGGGESERGKRAPRLLNLELVPSRPW